VAEYLQSPTNHVLYYAVMRLFLSRTKINVMLIAIMKVCVFFCILILPLRGPSRRRESTADQTQNAKAFSKYGVNERGGLEVVKSNDRTQTD
jgi:hypothetical protein